MSTAAIIAVALFGYILCGVATAGYFERRGWWERGDNTPMFFGVLFWPVFWTGAVIWRAFLRPLIPVFVGVYRVSAGMTFIPPDDDNEDLSLMAPTEAESGE